MAHTATLLADGRVLITGGFDASGVVRLTEFFDPATRSFSPGPSMVYPRGGHRALRLRNGSVVITGGGYPGEVFVPAWDRFVPAPELPPVSYVLAQLPDGAILSCHSCLACDLIDSATLRPIGGLPAVPMHGATALLPNGRLLVAGGWACELPFTSTGKLVTIDSTRAYRFSYFEQQGFSGTYGRLGRQSASVTPYDDRHVLIAGGECTGRNVDCAGTILSTTRLFDSATETTATGPFLRFPRTGHFSALQKDGWVFIAGGETSTAPYPYRRPLTETEFFDPRAHHFVAGPPMPEPRARAEAVVLMDGAMILIGGSVDGTYARLHGDALIFVPENQKRR